LITSASSETGNDFDSQSRLPYTTTELFIFGLQSNILQIYGTLVLSGHMFSPFFLVPHFVSQIIAAIALDVSYYEYVMLEP